MVITVECPFCASSFPVDSNKVPEGGVNARCSSCAQVFRVEKPKAGPAELPGLPGLSPPVADAAPAPTLPPLPEPPVAARPRPPEPPVAAPTPPEPAVASPSPTFGAASTPEAPAEPAVQGFTFGKRDPTDKAKRLARVLVSDMIMYNAERHRTALENGTLVADFEEEIDKSWKEFVEQVGQELASGEGQGFWREALNDILAKGQQVF